MWIDKEIPTKQGHQILESKVARSLEHSQCIKANVKSTLDYTFQLSSTAALYFGQKLHIYQNEKLKMHGVMYVVTRKGFSGKNVSLVTIYVNYQNMNLFRMLAKKDSTTHISYIFSMLRILHNGNILF